MLDPINRLPERLGVQRNAVAHATKIRYRNLVVPVPHGHYPGASHRVRRREREVAEADEE